MLSEKERPLRFWGATGEAAAHRTQAAVRGRAAERGAKPSKHGDWRREGRKGELGRLLAATSNTMELAATSKVRKQIQNKPKEVFFQETDLWNSLPRDVVNAGSFQSQRETGQAVGIRGKSGIIIQTNTNWLRNPPS